MSDSIRGSEQSSASSVFDYYAGDFIETLVKNMIREETDAAETDSSNNSDVTGGSTSKTTTNSADNKPAKNNEIRAPEQPHINKANDVETTVTAVDSDVPVKVMDTTIAAVDSDAPAKVTETTVPAVNSDASGAVIEATMTCSGAPLTDSQ